MATLKYEAVATVGKDKNGKPRYQKVGTVWESDKGLSLKLDCVPVGAPEWNGWVSLYVPKPKEAKPNGHQGAPTDSSEDVPFAPLHPRKWGMA